MTAHMGGKLTQLTEEDYQETLNADNYRYSESSVL